MIPIVKVYLLYLMLARYDALTKYNSDPDEQFIGTLLLDISGILPFILLCKSEEK